MANLLNFVWQDLGPSSNVDFYESAPNLDPGTLRKAGSGKLDALTRLVLRLKGEIWGYQGYVEITMPNEEPSGTCIVDARLSAFKPGRQTVPYRTEKNHLVIRYTVSRFLKDGIELYNHDRQFTWFRIGAFWFCALPKGVPLPKQS